MRKGSAKSVDLLLRISKEAKEPVYQQIYRQFKDAIISGVLPVGSKLPAIRNVSQNYCVSHITVEQAYLQLSSEGLVTNKPRSGYFVSPLDVNFLREAEQHNARTIQQIEEQRNRNAFHEENSQGYHARYDFSYANLQPDSFPVTTWRKITNEILLGNSQGMLTRYQRVDEESALARELTQYLQQARGVCAFPQQLILAPGTPEALVTLLQLFKGTHESIGIEEPGYAGVQEVARRMGFSMVSLSTEGPKGQLLEEVQQKNPKLVFVTPSNQFPTGKTLPMEDRIALLKWAHANNAYIIEDDSCHEYRHGTQPLPALQSLDAHGRVIYLGNFSKVLSPNMRVAYFVLPPELLARYHSLFSHAHPTVSWLLQETLARFIKEGHWERHVWKMSHANHKRRNELITCLNREFGDLVSVHGHNAGMHVYASVHNGMDQQQLIESARREGANVYGTKRFWFEHQAPENRIIIGYSSIALDLIPEGVKALKRAWF